MTNCFTMVRLLFMAILFRWLRISLALGIIITALASCHNSGNGKSAGGATSITSSEWEKTELYFGLSKPGGGTVSPVEWQEFLDKQITPEFKDGLTVYEAYGQYLGQNGKLTKENTRVVVLLYRKLPDRDKAILRIVESYKRLFQQESVLRVSAPVEVQF
jgi:hypothetical protein